MERRIQIAEVQVVLLCRQVVVKLIHHPLTLNKVLQQMMHKVTVRIQISIG